MRTADLLLVLAALPVLLLFVLAPFTFELSWAGFGKLGRGGLFFVLFFLAFELWDFRKTNKPRLDTARKAAVALCLAIALLYAGAVGSSASFVNMIYTVGKALGAAGDVSTSWLMAIDYIFMTLYLIALTATLFGIKSFRGVITPIIFSIGMFVFYCIDAFYPYGSIGPLQFWANFIVADVAFLAKGVGLPIFGLDNVLTISGLHGYYRLAVYWPSVGVQSMIIYSIVMLLLAAKLDSPLKRKLVYAVVGVVGTIFLNVLRIFIIAYYGYAYAYSGDQLDAFHNSIGEILFPIWIIGFLVIVLQIEGRLMTKEKAYTARTMKKSNSTHLKPNPRLPGTSRR
jgi:thaumarchaeosortase